MEYLATALLVLVIVLLVRDYLLSRAHDTLIAVRDDAAKFRLLCAEFPVICVAYSTADTPTHRFMSHYLQRTSLEDMKRDLRNVRI
jgi:hypothetical protein